MTAAEFERARVKMGLTTSGMAAALGLGKNGKRTIERIERGSVITGPMALAVRKLLDDALSGGPAVRLAPDA